MKTLNVHEVKTHLSALLDAVGRGEEIVILRYGKPAARLVPEAAPSRRRLGFYPITLTSDLLAADDDLTREFERGGEER